MKKKMSVTILLIILTIMGTFTIFFPYVKATDVKITRVSPETCLGKVGEEVRIIGTINTTGGLYRIWFDGQEINQTYAIGYEVDITFRVPSLPEGNYTITLEDDETKNNATTWFYIETAYYVTAITPPSPEQKQEGDSVDLNVTITGGQPNTPYHANITVKLPDPLNNTYSSIVELNTNDTGYGNENITYPDESRFQPSGSHTNYTGLYLVYFNKTQDLAEHGFFVGLTNVSSYHREDFAEIVAVGYQPNETATITITYMNTNETFPPLEVNAKELGTINASWQIPWNASIGEYNVTITGKNTTKPIRDSQIFSVPGYQIEVYTRNLAEDAVPDILVEALDHATNTTFSNETKTDGVALFWLEKGNHTLEAFWNEVKVSEKTNITIPENRTNYLICELTNVKIAVKDKDENLIPFVYLNISYQYMTTKEGKVENGSVTGETDISGVFSINSTLPHINYTIEASRYGIVFNTNNNTIENLPAQGWFPITILCPPKTLTLNITEHHRNPIPNAQIELIEQMGGISYNTITNDTGIATIDCTFGKYEVKVYMNNILLNSTFIEIFNDTLCEIYCKLYNLTVSVKIVDYFGQPIPNANVTLQREGLAPNSSRTQSDGKVTFDSITGGKLWIAVYLFDHPQSCITKEFTVDEPATIEIKIDKYVLLAGFFVETNQLTTAIIIAVIVILVLSIEVYRKKRFKPQKSES